MSNRAFIKAFRVLVLPALFAAFTIGSAPAAAATSDCKLDPLLEARVSLLGNSRMIVRATSSGLVGSLLTTVRLLGGTVTRQLPLIDGLAIDLPNLLIPVLASNPVVLHMSYDRTAAGSVERTGAVVGATAVREELGLDGAGVGIAVIDSGVTPWHDDLADSVGAQRVDRFVDFVNGRSAPYDDYGHGTHVAGIIAGNGTDSSGGRTGIAPAAHLVVLKVLDGTGQGRISDVIAALDYVVSHKTALNIRVVNLSVATGVYESYTVDPLTVAAGRVVSAGITVVAAAGNNGRGRQGTAQYGGVTAPGNAPWVLTVGASSHMGTVDRGDDTVAGFSSRGPSAVDYTAKPDIVAPGVGIESLTSPLSRLYALHPEAMLTGTVATSYFPYLSLSGTSMAAPVVTGTIALMLQANPSLTPNLAKAILEYTAQVYDAYDPLTQGAGFLNARGAVELARYLGAPATTPYPSTDQWSQRIIWGNHLARGGVFTAAANAWLPSVTWGAAAAPDGARVTWGTICALATCDAQDPQTWSPWQTACVDAECQALDAAAGPFPNVVWGSLCEGADCAVPWTTTIARSAGSDGDTVVWGTGSADGDTVVWGTTSDGDTVVWGTSSDGDTVVWGTSCTDSSCDTVIWGGAE